MSAVQAPSAEDLIAEAQGMYVMLTVYLLLKFLLTNLFGLFWQEDLLQCYDSAGRSAISHFFVLSSRF